MRSWGELGTAEGGGTKQRKRRARFRIDPTTRPTWMSKRNAKDNDFITNGASSDEDNLGIDEIDDLEDDLSIASSDEAGPSRSRFKRARRASGASPAKKGKASAAGGTKSKGKGKGKTWEGDFEHTWDTVREDERGTLEGAISDLLLGSKARRCVQLI